WSIRSSVRSHVGEQQGPRRLAVDPTRKVIGEAVDSHLEPEVGHGRLHSADERGLAAARGPVDHHDPAAAVAAHGAHETIGPLMADGDPPGVRSPQPENTRLITTNMKTIARTTATTTVTITCFTGRSCAIVTAADLSATRCRDRDAFCPSATPPRSSRPPPRRPRAPSA